MSGTAQRVLLVDDDSDIVELLEYNLTREGYSVLGITNPSEVLPVLNRFSPHILVMDIFMPQINGFQLCAAVRQMEYGRDLPIFFITTGEDRLCKEALDCGGDDFIQKFSGLRTLISRIDLVVKKKLVIQKRLEKISVGKWNLNRQNKTVRNHNHEIKLSEPEFDLFYFLAQNARRSIPIKFLTNVISNSEFLYGQFSLSQCLQLLAKKVGEGLIVFTSEQKVRLNIET